MTGRQAFLDAPPRRPRAEFGAEPLADGTGVGLRRLDPGPAGPRLLSLTDETTPERFYPRFRWSVIAPIEAHRWPLDAGAPNRLPSRFPVRS